ncbi:Facilitated trehalose transporter Tret1-2 [Orchesella cincta]|uniref:Facilitated trehalose transporter Tret1-2 n=1 Tax=Orchesella cincta TaxID=48709 RepID=A0A1D2MTA9_ORCCI|nr:Facilitated trehalose transporter Tret1-2 [Orchesella cincta]
MKWSTIVAACSFLCIGLLRAYTSPAIASMKQDPYLFNSTSIPSKDIISWVAASPPLASFFGTLLSGPLLHYLGRRGTLTLLTFPYTVGWLMIGFAGTSIPLIMLGRVLTGLAAGLSTASAQLYVSECVRPTVRGTLGFLPAMMLSLGVLVGFAAGTINVDWRQLAFIMTCFPVVLFLMTFTLPESPAWLLLKGKEDQGFISLKRLRGGTKENMEAVEMEFKDMKTGILMKEERIPVLQLLRQRAIWYPAGVATFLMFFQMFTGANAVIYYLSVILTEAEPRNITSSSSFMAATTTLSHDLSSVVVGVVQFLAFFVSLPLIDRVGRRILLVSSAIAMAIPLGILGSYYYCNQSDSGPKCVNMIESTGSWLPLACLSVFIAAYSIGFNSIPFILMSELFPSSARSYLCSLTSFVNHFCLFLLIKGFPLALDTVGPHWTFWGFCAVCIVSVPFVLITVPETKGKSLAEIERGFAKHS